MNKENILENLKIDRYTEKEFQIKKRTKKLSKEEIYKAFKNAELSQVEQEKLRKSLVI